MPVACFHFKVTHMPVSFAELVRRVENFDLIEEAKEVLRENPDEIPRLIRMQMYSGIHGGTGGKIGRYKDPAYAVMKHELNPDAGLGNVDLRLTGEHYSGIEARLTGGNGIETHSRDKKGEWLADRYGDEIYRLTGESTGALRRDILSPGLVQKWRQKVGGRTR